MNKKLITGSLTLGIVYAFVFASTASAFWPFDSLFKKSGDVKAETTEKKMVVGDVGPGGSRAEMTYRTLVSLNDTCRRLLSVETPQPTRTRITPSARDTTTSDSDGRKMAAKKVDDMYMLEFGIEGKNEKELTSIYNNLKARCDNIASLVTRMQKIYKGSTRPTTGDRPSQIINDDGGANRPTNTKYIDDRERPSVSPTRRPIINFKIRDDSQEKN